MGRAASQPCGQDERGGLAAALLHEGLGGLRVDGDPYGSGVPGQQVDGGLHVHPAEGAGPDVGDAGERALRDGDDEAVRVVGDEGVDLLGVDGVVEEQQDAPDGQGLADHLGQLVLARAGRARDAERGEDLAGGGLGGDRVTTGLGEPGPYDSVGIAVREPHGRSRGRGRYGPSRGARR